MRADLFDFPAIFQAFWDSLFGQFADAWDLITSPLIPWWASYAALVVLCVFIAYFLPFKWIRAGLGGLLVLAGAFLAGGTVMYRSVGQRLKDEQARAKERERQAKAEQPQKPNFWPF